jgi:DNA-directed RNA polymerase subunit beta'
VRPILPSRGKRDLLVSDANYLYRDAMLANDMLTQAKKVLPDKEIGNARLHLYDATRAVFGLGEAVSPQLKGRQAKGYITAISGKGSPKRGFFHGRLLRRPQDLSARGTAAPDLSLDMDQVGLPEDMLWRTYEPHIMRQLSLNGYKAMDARRMIEERHPTARDALMRETKTRPVIMNRAPTLHRFNMIGAYPVPVDGRTIRVNPFMEIGQNLDYDGDTLQIHVPVTDKAVNEVKSLTLSNQLFGDKTKSELMVFPQHEAVLGVYTASAAKGGKTKKFKTKTQAMEAYRKGEVGLNDKVQIG